MASPPWRLWTELVELSHHLDVLRERPAVQRDVLLDKRAFVARTGADADYLAVLDATLAAMAAGRAPVGYVFMFDDPIVVGAVPGA